MRRLGNSQLRSSVNDAGRGISSRSDTRMMSSVLGARSLVRNGRT